MPSLYIGEQPVRTVALASNNDDATAVAADVMKDKIAYNQYGKIVGTAEPAEDLDNEMTAQDSLIEQIKSAVASKASVSYPTLSNPASAGNIESGYQAIDGSGKMIEGTAVVGVETPAFTLVNYKPVSADLFTVDNTKTYLALLVITDRNSGNLTYGGWCFIKNGAIVKQQTVDGSIFSITSSVLKSTVNGAFFYFTW